MLDTLFALAAPLLAATFQDPAPPAPPATPAAPTLPAPGSAAAAELLGKGIEKMLAIGRGTWKTTEAQDQAMMRNAGMPFGANDTDVDGGWHQGLVWGEIDNDRYVRHAGRMLVKAGDVWKLRENKLASGHAAPFTLDVELFFTVLRELPEAARRVEHVDAAEVGGKKVVVLSLSLADEDAADLVASGAVPGGGGGGGMFMIGNMRGFGGAPPEPDYAVHLAFFVDPDNGDVVRLAARIYEKNPMFGNVVIQVQGPGGQNEDEEEEEEDEKADAKAGAPVWKDGLPVRKPSKSESMTTFRADFGKLGLATAPDLDDHAKALLRLR